MSQSEESLLRGIKRGDSQAFAVAMDRYMDMIYSLAYSMLGDPQDAEDACQEVFLRLHGAASRLRANSSLPSWLYRSCINYCVDESRRRYERNICGKRNCLQVLVVYHPGMKIRSKPLL